MKTITIKYEYSQVATGSFVRHYSVDVDGQRTDEMVIVTKTNGSQDGKVNIFQFIGNQCKEMTGYIWDYDKEARIREMYAISQYDKLHWT